MRPAAHGDRKSKHKMVHKEVASFPNAVTYKTKQNYGYQQCVQDFVRLNIQ